MNSVIAAIVLVATISVCIVLTAATPNLLSDSNSFLRAFVTHELVAFMGIIVTISLSSASAIYLELGRIGRDKQIDVSRPKKGVRATAVSLVIALVVSIVIAIVKSFSVGQLYLEASINSSAIVLVVFSTLLLTDLVQAGFSVGDLA